MSHAIEVRAFRTKQVGEKQTLSFDYRPAKDPLLASAETISTAVFTATVSRGTDAAPENIISGAATISGSQASQLIIGGVANVQYLIKCVITTSLGQTLHGLGYLTVTNDTRPA